MAFGSSLGRSGYRDDRRRRLLVEERAAGTGQPARSESTHTAGADGPGTMRSTVAHKSENYGDAEFLAEQPGLSDLVPRRFSTVAAIFLLGLAGIGGLLALDTYCPGGISPQIPKSPNPQISAFDLAAAGSLARWFSALLLLGAAAVALLVYSIRRYKVHDYQGRYRIWVWAAVCCFLVATDTAAPLHGAFSELMTALAGTRLLGDGSIWWIVPAALLLGAVGSRLLVDMWECRSSSGLAILALGCYAVAVAAHYGWLGPHAAGARAGLLVDHGARMTGHLLLLTAMGWHARHVLLDAQGLLPRRQAQSGTAADEDAEGAPGQEAGDGPAADAWVAVDPPHGIGQPVLRRVGASGLPGTLAAAAGVPSVPAPLATSGAPAYRAPSSGWPGQTTAASTVGRSQPVSAPPPAALPSSSRKLTKLERKAMKKRLLEARLQRQQRGS
jgi:hypothetical protein